MCGVRWKGPDVQVALREGHLYLLGTKPAFDVESEVGRNAAVFPGIRDPDEEREVEAGVAEPLEPHLGGRLRQHLLMSSGTASSVLRTSSVLVP